MQVILRSIALVIALVSILLMAINLYGLTQEIRPTLNEASDLRFNNDLPLPFDDAMTALTQVRKIEDPEVYAQQVTMLIAKSIAHIHWNEELNPDKFNQRIPIWENFILYSISYLTSIPEFTKYHFINVERSFERGIGICGDASMILSQLLDEHHIANQIIGFQGHVVVEAVIGELTYLLDADYGVVMPFSADQVQQSPHVVDRYYKEAGYPEWESIGIQNIYATSFSRWNGVPHFVTKKYYFEPIAYVFKWALPFLGIAAGLGVLMYGRRQRFEG